MVFDILKPKKVHSSIIKFINAIIHSWLVEWSSHPHPEYWIPVNLQATTENSSLSTLLDFIIKSKGKPVSSWLISFSLQILVLYRWDFLTGGGGGCQASSGGWEWVGLIQKWKTIKHFHILTYIQRQSRKKAKMTQKHIQAKASKDKLCETQNQNYSAIKKKQHNLCVRFKPFPLLEFSPPLERCSDIYAGPTPCLILNFLFNVLFLWYFPLLLSAISLYL